MSLQSMTGLGEGTASFAGREVRVEVSSLNRKQLDVQVQLPRSCSALEAEIVQEVRGVLQRGRVHVAVWVESQGRENTEIRMDVKLAGRLLERLRDAADTLNLKDDVTVSTLYRFPQVLEFVEPEMDRDALWTAMRKALRQAVKGCRTMREAEGQVLQKDLNAHLKRLRAAHKRMARHAPRAARRFEQNLKDRLHELGMEALLDDERLRKEVAMLGERSDVTEELDRLASHFAQVEDSFTSRKPVGRMLDFLAQEMLREVNTIGSKCSDGEITKNVITFKTDLERFREQVQNIE